MIPAQTGATSEQVAVSQPAAESRPAEGSQPAAASEPVEATSDAPAFGGKPLLRKAIAGVCALVAVMLVSLFVNPGRGFFSFEEVGACYELWFAHLAASFAAPFDILDGSRVAFFHADYYTITGRVGSTFSLVLCGAAAAIAGLLFQAVAKDQLALVPVVGASSAAGVSDAILVALFGIAAPALLPHRWLVGALLAVGAVAVMVRVRKGSGSLRAAEIIRRKGTMLAVAGAYFVVWSLWQLLAASPAGLGGAPSIIGWVTIVVVCAAGVVPVAVLHVRIDALGLSDEEAQQRDIDLPFARRLALGCGIALLVVAQVHVGPIALFALVVPAIARRVFGEGFLRSLLGCALIGSILLVLCSFTGCAALVANACGLAMLVGVAVLQRA